MIGASVVVPTFNRAGLLPGLLDALLRQDYSAPYEVIVVDDGSSDDTPKVMAECCSRHAMLQFLRQDNAGPARARNLGASHARGRFVAFIDDDCLPEPDWLRALDAALVPGAAAAAGTVINREEGWVGRYVNRESVIHQVLASDGSVAELITGNAAVLSSVFEQVGGFDEAIRVAGGEDTEFSFRLRAAGHRIVSAPGARVRHLSAPTDVWGYLRMIFRHGRGRRRLATRFPAYGFRFAAVRLLWLAWPVRGWMLRDYRRYRAGGVGQAEACRYVVLRYLENITRVAGYLRG